MTTQRDDQDATFKALADASRRHLLDLLFQKDGQTLSELVAHFEGDSPFKEMGRFGVMKHLRILEDAGLVTTRKSGREKYHYLNPVPIQMTYDRWVSKYAQPWASAMTGLKYQLEAAAMDKHKHVFMIYIRTTPEALWRALTDGDLTQRYYFATRVESTWQPGAAYSYTGENGKLIEGEVIEVDPPRRLVTTFKPLWMGEMPASRVTFEIEPEGAVCKLTLTHDDLERPLGGGLFDGWSRILSDLKTLLETGEVMEA
jgi:uncharacterized protein YndB with AHSA1/START domain